MNYVDWCRHILDLFVKVFVLIILQYFWILLFHFVIWNCNTVLLRTFSTSPLQKWFYITLPPPNRHLSTTALYLRPQGCQKCREVWLYFLKPVCNVNCTSPICFITELPFVKKYSLGAPGPFLHHHNLPLKKNWRSGLAFNAGFH